MATGSIVKDYSQVDRMTFSVNGGSSGAQIVYGFNTSATVSNPYGLAKYGILKLSSTSYSGTQLLYNGSLTTGVRYYAVLFYMSFSDNRTIYSQIQGYYTGGTTITFNANGGSGAPSSITTYWSGTSAMTSQFFANAIPSTIPTRTGYTFLGWSSSSTATSATWTAGQEYPVGLPSTLYAVWKLKKQTMVKVGNSWKLDGQVCVKANGAWKSATSIKIKVNGAWTLVTGANEPTNPGDPVIK